MNRRDWPSRQMVLPPAQSFAALNEALAAVGYTLVDETRLGSGPDPDRATWQGQGGELRLFRDLASGLQILVPSGTAAIPPAVRRIGRNEILELLGSTAAKDRLAAIQAVEAGCESSLLVMLLPLLVDSDATVAGEAQRVLEDVVGRLLPALAPDVAAHPLAALFAVPGWRREKLQLLRWLGRDGRPAAAAAESILARALADPDWEIAISAMLAAGRLGVQRLAGPIARMAMPEGKRLGLTHTEARLILALRDACLVRMGARAPGGLPAGVAEAVLGETSHLPLALAPLVTALTMPLPTDLPEPPQMAGIRWTAGGPELFDGRLLIWVPPVPHWLGDEALDPGPQPVRRYCPARGFFIEAEPRPAATHAEALDDIARSARETGLAARLPPPHLWEMAARGPDGRRYPWGLNPSPEASVDLSPWGLSGIATGPGEWLDGFDDAGRIMVAGGEKLPIPAARRGALREERRAYRSIWC